VLCFNIVEMGKYLGIDINDTYEVYMIANKIEVFKWDFPSYSRWIKSMKEIYGKEKGLSRHQTMGDFLIRNFQDFHQWIANYHKDILPHAGLANSE